MSEKEYKKLKGGLPYNNMTEIIPKPSKFEQKSIGQLLSENFFIVPYNQRPYTWEEDRWEELWDDLKDIRKDRLQDSRDPYKIYHFLGPMFFIITPENKLEIFDGQQRLVTITLMLQVIWDLLDEINQAGRYTNESVTAMTLIRPKIVVEEDEGIKHRIKIGSDGKRAYEHFLKDNLTPSDKLASPNILWNTEPERQLRKCYKFFLDQIPHFFLKSEGIQFNDQNMLSKALMESEFIPYLKKLSQYIVEGFYVLTSDVPDISIGYEMFETLNQRGEKLLTIDLFKNLLFSKFQRVIEVEEINNFWNDLKSTVEEKNLGYFLRHYWISEHDFVRDKKLFIAIKDYFVDLDPDRNAFDELKDTLLHEGKIYAALLEETDSLWQNNPEISDVLGELNYLGFKQQLPLFLSAHICLFQDSVDKFKELLKTYLVFSVRRNIFMRKSPSEFEEEHSRWARQIREDPSKIDEIIGELKDEIRKAYSINDQIDRGLELKDKHAKYILWKINDAITPSNLTKCYRNDPTLEHVIPKSPEAWWSNLLRQKNMRHEDFINKLGNLTLLSKEENSDLGNTEYPTKKRTYIEKQLPLNLKTFEGLDDFGEEEIKTRERILSEIISEKELWQ